MAKKIDHVSGSLNVGDDAESEIGLRRASDSEDFSYLDGDNQPFTVTLSDTNAPSGVSSFSGTLTGQSTTDPVVYSATVTCHMNSQAAGGSSGGGASLTGQITITIGGDTSFFAQIIPYIQ